MVNLTIDIFRALVTGAIFFYLRSLRKKEDVRFHKGWFFVPIGFAMIFFGSLLDITDNFPNLNKYFLIGNTKYEQFLEEIIGYLFGFVFVRIGFWKWIPSILALRKVEKILKQGKKNYGLKLMSSRRNSMRFAFNSSRLRLL